MNYWKANENERQSEKKRERHTQGDRAKQDARQRVPFPPFHTHSRGLLGRGPKRRFFAELPRFVAFTPLFASALRMLSATLGSRV